MFCFWMGRAYLNIEFLFAAVTRKPNKLEAAASNNNNSILRFALPIQKQSSQNLSPVMETTSVDKEVTPRKLVSDQS